MVNLPDGSFRPMYATVDHIIPLSRGGRSDLGNLRLLCARCHRDRNIALCATTDYVPAPPKPPVRPLTWRHPVTTHQISVATARVEVVYPAVCYGKQKSPDEGSCRG